MLYIIKQSLTRRWLQSFSTLLSVALSAGILFALYMLYLGVSAGLEKGARQLGADLVVIPADAWVEPEAVLFTGAPMIMYMDAGFEEKVAHIPGVRSANAQFFTQTLNADCCSLSNATRLIGFNPDSDRLISALFENAGKNPLASDEILTGAEVEGFPDGQALVLGRIFRVAGVLEPTGTSLDYSILMSINSARMLAKAGENSNLQRYWERYGQPDHLISAILVEVDGNHKEEVARSIRSFPELKVIETSGVMGSIKAQMESLFLVILGGGLLALLSSAVNLFSRFYCMAWDRKGEWGLYRALGATRRKLKLLVVGEALILSTGGVILGITLGYGLYYGVLELLRLRKAFPFIAPSVSEELLGIAGAAGIFSLIGIVSAWFPANRSARIEPSAAMALEDID